MMLKGTLYISNTTQQSYIIWNNQLTKQNPVPIVWNFTYKKLPKEFKYTDYTFPITQDTLQEHPITIYINPSSGITDTQIAWCGSSKPTCVIQKSTDSIKADMTNGYTMKIETLESAPIETYQQKSKIIEKPMLKDSNIPLTVAARVVYDSKYGVLRDQKTNVIYNCSKWELWKKIQYMYKTTTSGILELEVELRWNIFSEKYQVSTIRE